VLLFAREAGKEGEREGGRDMARREPRDDARIRVVQVSAGEAHTLALTGILSSPQ
jgi:hypothetical protein